MKEFSVDLSGRVAIVTGAGRMAGRTIARVLAQAGAAVCAVDMNPDRVAETVDRIQALGGQAMPWTGDMSNRFQVAAMIESVRDRFGSLNQLVTIATTDKRAPLLALDEFDWRRSLEMNLTAAFFCTQLAGRVMADEGGGSIVHVTDTIGLASTGEHSAPYAASNAGIIGLTRQSARELAPHNVRVNAICAPHLSEASPSFDPELMPETDAKKLRHLADAVLSLSSQGASGLVGQVIVVGGGEHPA